jgi:dTDP-4-dehydrorhamnose reductase
VRLLIAGGSGYLGREVARQAGQAGHHVTATYLTRPATEAGEGVRWRQLDVRSRPGTTDAIAAARPQVVVNAAYRHADWATTADGAAHVAAGAAATGAHLVHVSSDALFSGAASPYDESAVPDPVLPYGAAKAAAETAVRAILPAATVARTSLITGDGRSPHEALVHDIAAGRTAAVLFTDDIRCPVHVADLAAAVLELALARQAGIQHVAGADAVSRYELGCLIARRDGLDPGRLPAGLRAGRLPGPLDVRLDCRATQARLSTRLRGAREFLRDNGAGSSNAGVSAAR